MARRGKKPVRTNAPAVDIKKSGPVTTTLVVSVIIAVILGGIPFGLGKYIEFNSPGPFDSGAFVYSAQHLLQGAKFGVEEQSSARPNTLLANIIGVKLFGFSEFGPKFVQMVLQLGALGFMFYTQRKVFGSIAAVVGTSVAAIYLSAPLIAKFGNVKEQFMIPFMIAAACCFLLYGTSQKRYWLLLSGFFAIQPYYFKPTGLSIVAALLLCIIAANLLSKRWKSLALELALLLTGYLAGLLIPGSLYLWQGMPKAILNTLPFVLLTAGFVFGIMIVGVIAVIVLVNKYRLLAQLQQVSKWIWIAGLCLLLIVIMASVSMIKKEPGFQDNDITSFFQDIPLVSIPQKLFSMVDAQVNKLLAASGIKGGYVKNSWGAIGISRLAPKVFRYYKALSVPILLGLGSMVAAVWYWLPGLIKKAKNKPDDVQLKLVCPLALWWILDMLFVWGSPRSYEQYYLPLCASGAMLGGFLIWQWQKHLSISRNNMAWLASGVAAAVTLSCLSMPIFIGQRYSPDTGADYVKNYGQRRRGFGPALKELPSRKQGAWIAVGDYIRAHSDEDDTIYVWGWVPGIYVQAQRMAPVPKAFEGDMHVMPPERLKWKIIGMVNRMKENPPEFIVDSRKQHFPNDRPPLELWPMVPPKMFGNEKGRFLNNNPQEIAAFDAALSKYLESQIEPKEAERYEAMKPFRNFVMNDYRITGQFGNHILFEKK